VRRRASLEIHYKLFGTDGVSLQSQELSRALSHQGWSVHFCASDVPDNAPGRRLPELAYQSPDAVALRARLFPKEDGTKHHDASAVERLLEEVRLRARPIRQGIESYLDESGIAVVHLRNLMSLPYNLPASLALYELAAVRRDIGFVMQHHDLYWEGPNAASFATPYAEVHALMNQVMCPDLPNVRHVVINPIAAEALRVRRGIDATVLPDAFDFTREVPEIDDTRFRRRLEVLTGDTRPVTTDDLVVSMPARVAINKAIELAIQFVAGLNAQRTRLLAAPDGLGRRRRRFSERSRVVLMLPQGEDLRDNQEYFDRLVAYARHLDVTLAYGGAIVVPDRRYRAGDAEHVPFYGTYRAADLVCYSPEHEGFGNQAIETVWARCPLVVLEYPVFKRFVAGHLPHYVSLGDTEQLGRTDVCGGLHELRPGALGRAIDQAVALLEDHDLERQWVDDNLKELQAFCGADTVAKEYVALYNDLMRRRS
jgi:hypothetical protein